MGDIFKWWVEVVCQGDGALHAQVSKEAEALRPGQSGLLALDWNNGNRTVLVDPLLTGLLLGQTLYTTPAEIYRALIEATAFGARAIIERIREYGVPITRVVCCGGIAEKNALLMQIYADVTGRTMQVAGSSQACALGVRRRRRGAGRQGEGRLRQLPGSAGKNDVAQGNRLPARIPRGRKSTTSSTRSTASFTTAFGGRQKHADLGHVMKDLIRIKQEQHA